MSALERKAHRPQVAFIERLYREHQRRVRWVLRGRGVDDAELDDVVHDAFLAMHRRLPQRDPELPEPIWVSGVARSVAFSHRRATARRKRIQAQAPAPTDVPAPDEAVEREDAWRQLQAFLDTLDDDQREAFVLIELVGMRAPEVANLADAPVNTISSRLRLARRRFERRFGVEPAKHATFLRAAGAGECPSAATRRRTWSAIAMSVGLPLPIGAAEGMPTATSAVGTTVSWSVATWIVAAATATVVATAALSKGAIDDQRPSTAVSTNEGDAPRTRTAPKATSREDAAPASPTRPLASAPAVQHRRARSATPSPESPESSKTPRARAVAPRRTEAGTHRARLDADTPAADTELAEAIAVLARAESARANGDPAGALAAVDRYRSAFPRDPLRRERTRVERRAACAFGDWKRAAVAHAELVTMGLRSGEKQPCT